MASSFQYSVSNDFPGGKINTSKLQTEIRASSIKVALDCITVDGDTVTIAFKADLDAADKFALDGDQTNPAGGLIANHDSSPSTGDAEWVKQKLNYGDDPTVIDGVSCSFAADEWERVEYTMTEALSIQQVHVTFVGMQAGDYGRLSILHPVNANGYSNPTAAVTAGATAIPCPADFAAVAAAAPGVAIEFWDDDDSDLVEIRPIASSNGTDTVTLAEAVGHDHTTGDRMRLVVGCFCPVGSGGVDHLAAGFHAVGSSHIMFGSEAEATAQVPAGLQLAHRFRASSVAGTRMVAVSYRFRRVSM